MDAANVSHPRESAKDKNFMSIKIALIASAISESLTQTAHSSAKKIINWRSQQKLKTCCLNSTFPKNLQILYVQEFSPHTCRVSDRQTFPAVSCHTFDTETASNEFPTSSSCVPHRKKTCPLTICFANPGGAKTCRGGSFQLEELLLRSYQEF